MDLNPENNAAEFESLRRLLALKQHEVPPPRFFNELPSRIMARIEVERPGVWDRLLDSLFAHSWFQPVAASGVALVVGTLFLCALGGTDHAGGGNLTRASFLGSGTGTHPGTLQVESTAPLQAPSLQPQVITAPQR
jgi:hypothetical protein